MASKLVQLYGEMAALTAPLCGSAECEARAQQENRCCERRYCEIAARFAKTVYGLDLPETGHPALPYMGPGGCAVAPHLRPLCTLHTCGQSFPGKILRNLEYERLRALILEQSQKEGIDLPAWYNSALPKNQQTKKGSNDEDG